MQAGALMMMTMTKICFCLFLHLCCAQQIAPDTSNTFGLCQNINIALLQNTSTGIRILLTGSTAHLTNEFIDVPNYYLPPECGVQHHRCSILQFEHSNIIYYVIPSVRALIVLSHNTNSINHTNAHKSFITISKRCNPTKAFYAGREGGHRIFVACMDLQTQQEGKLSYLQFYFSPNGTYRGSILNDTEAVFRTETIYDPETVSEVIFVRGQKGCAYLDNLYFIDDSFVLHYPADYQAFDPEFLESRRRLEKCDSVQRIENVGGDNLIIRCSNGQTVLYDTCASVFMYPSVDRVPYPCSNWDAVLYWNRSSRTLKENSDNLENLKQLSESVSDFSYGTCVEGEEGEEPTFVGLASDGTVFIAPLDGRNVTNISGGGQYINCSSSGHNAMMCSNRPVFSDSRQVFGIYDIASEEFLVVNVTVECQNQPIVIRINLTMASFSPDLVAISSGKGHYNCTCQGESTKTPATQSDSHAITTVSYSMHSASTTSMPATAEMLATRSTNTSEPINVVVVVLPIVAVLVSLGIIIALIVGVLVVYLYLSQKWPCDRRTMPYQPCNSDTSKVCIGIDNPLRNDSFNTSSVVEGYNSREQQRDDLNSKLQAFRAQQT